MWSDSLELSLLTTIEITVASGNHYLSTSKVNIQHRLRDQKKPRCTSCLTAQLSSGEGVTRSPFSSLHVPELLGLFSHQTGQKQTKTMRTA